MSDTLDRFNFTLTEDEREWTLQNLCPVDVSWLTPTELEVNGPLLCLGPQAKMYWESEVEDFIAGVLECNPRHDGE